MMAKLTDIQNILRDNHIITCFSGRFSQGVIEELGVAIKNHMKSEASPKSMIYNVFSVYIEQAQNIKNYISSKENSPAGKLIANSSVVCIGTTAEAYFIWSGNLVEHSDVGLLHNRLELIAGRNKDELKQIYKEELKKEMIPGARGAGIGLIDIARKASLPLEYSFQPIDDQLSFYEIKVVI
jgi:hypothetical protein